MRPGGRGVRGEEGKADASLSSICRMLWMTSPAPEHRSARSFLDRKHNALPRNILNFKNTKNLKLQIREIYNQIKPDL